MTIPPFHWWRTVFYLIPLISIYTIVLGTLSVVSSLFERNGRFAHWCARTWSRLILATTGVRVRARGLEGLAPGETYVFVSNHQSIYDIPIVFDTLPLQLRIVAKASLGRFKGGPFLIAIDAGLPLVPVTVAHSRHVMLKGRLMTCPGKVDLIVHEPIATAGLTREDARALAERVRAVVAAGLVGAGDGPLAEAGP